MLVKLEFHQHRSRTRVFTRRERERDQHDQTDRSCKDWSFIYVWSLHTFGNKKASNTFVDSYCTSKTYGGHGTILVTTGTDWQDLVDSLTYWNTSLESRFNSLYRSVAGRYIRRYLCVNSTKYALHTCSTKGGNIISKKLLNIPDRHCLFSTAQ